MKIRKYIPHCIASGLLLLFFVLLIFPPPIYSYWMCVGLLFVGIASFIVAMFRACRGLARLTWVVSTVLFLCAGSWAYYDEFKIFGQRGYEGTFQIKFQVASESGLSYGFRFFVGVWAIYSIWKLLKYIAGGSRNTRNNKTSK